MKNFQRNAFVLIAIALCATCAWQWHLQDNQLAVIDRQNKALFDNEVGLRDLSNSVKLRDDQINQLQDRVAELKKSLMTNEQAGVEQKRELARLVSSADIMSNQITQYKAAVENFETKLKQAYDGEKELAAQRDDFAKRVNDGVQAQNAITKKYNDLVDRFNKLQSNAAPAK